MQFLGEFGIAMDAADVAVPWFERALALAREHRFAAGEAISIHSLGVAAFISGDLPRADELVARSIHELTRLGGSSETIPSPLNIAEVRLNQPESRPGLRHVFEDTLQPFVEISSDAAASYELANQAAIARVRGDLPRAWALLEESESRFARRGRRRGPRHGVRAARLHGTRRRGRRGRACPPRSRPRAACGAGRNDVVEHSSSPASGW